MKKYPVAKPDIGKKEIGAVVSVLRSDILSIGPRIKVFEKKFARAIGTKYACAVSSGTAGLHLALIAADIGKGDEVITSPFSFVASANTILYVGAKPVFVDIDPHTYNLDPNKIEKKITNKTKAILVVHIFGQSADMNPIMRLAKKHKLKVIEDACESMLATYNSKMVGTFGQSAVFAFYPNKQMTTGEGGMIVTDSKKVYDLCCSLRNQGRFNDTQWLNHSILGYNYRMDEMSAALGIVQLSRVKSFIHERQKISAWYSHYLTEHSDLFELPVVRAVNTHTWFVYVVCVLAGKKTRNRLIYQLEKRKISTRPYLPSIHLFDHYKKFLGYKKGDYPESEKISDTALALPLYTGLRERDCKYIVDTLMNEIEKL